MPKPRITLSLKQVFTGSILLLLGFVSYLFYSVYDSSTQSILQISERLRDEASREISAQVLEFLKAAESAAATVEKQISLGAISPTKPDTVRRGLIPLLLDNADIDEIAVTYGRVLAYDEDGYADLSPIGRGQVIVSRAPDGSLRVQDSAPKGFDPTSHRTFTTPASKRLQGQLLWSDLHWPPGSTTAIDPDHARVSVQKGFQVADWVAVVRVALKADRISRIATGARPAPYQVFLCDNRGRLITRLSPNDRLEESGDDLRFTPTGLAPEIAQALSHSALKSVGDEKESASIRWDSSSGVTLATFRRLGGTQDWIVGIVVPEAHYLQGLTESRNRLLFTSGLLILGIVLGGILVLHGLKSAQDQFTAQTTRMNRFDFTPSAFRSSFKDVNTSLESLEKAKTAMRVMGKYAPLELVRKLYEEKREPVLGGEPADLTLMFTDIADFTTISEKLPSATLSEALGKYLESMVGAIQHWTGGTVDKFIGDAIMAFWNAPKPTPDAAARACEAALACSEIAEHLFASPDWKGLPPFVTRIGLHRDRVRVGHFGAPERMNYTAIGDGVNLASRLEGLNKQYGTRIIASQTVYEEARESFEFRLLDRVAVKGKTQGLDVYELLGRKGEVGADLLARARKHEAALAAYRGRDFVGAQKIWGEIFGDPAAAAFIERCESFLREPPGAEWDGTMVAHFK